MVFRIYFYQIFYLEYHPMQELISHIEKFIPNLDDRIRQDITQFFKLRKLTKGEHLVHEGQISKNVYFIKKGLLRNYIIKNDKDETIWFCFPEDFITVFSSFQLQIPGRENTIALTDCELYWISFEKLEELNAQSHAWERLSRVFTIKFAIQQETRLFMLQTMNAEEKYDYLGEHFPHIIQQIPNKYVASYLGITRETLSRIRARKT